MDLDNETWRDIDLNIDSLWIMGPRAKGGKRENNYHGNFAPQIPNELIQRFTKQGQTVMDVFMGSGTTLFECEILKRNYIGFDINEDIISVVENKMLDCQSIKYSINNCNILDACKVAIAMDKSLRYCDSDAVDLILSHPPYMDVVKFTDKPEDLSSIDNVSQFIEAFIESTRNVWRYLRANGTFALVIGDIYKNSEVIPLGFYLMNAIQKNFKCQLKGIVIKDIVNNRGKQGTQGIHKYRALKFGYYIFKHEYIFVFKKK